MIRATVVSTSNEGEVREKDDLWKAIVRVDEVIKRDGKIGDRDEIEVYYLQPRDRQTPGWLSNRCPTYPRVEVGDQQLFYLLQADLWDGSETYWISIGQDVRTSKAWHIDTMPTEGEPPGEEP